MLATAVTELAEHLDGKPASRALLRAQVGRPRKEFGDTLVSVTGAGSGIGRETALAFAREGAELIVSDIDEASLKETVAQIGARGGVAHPYLLDVSDAEAVEQFADEVCAAHGVPDIVVNNAGIGVAGAFLDTPAEQFDKVLDVNLGGVVNGCRSFARRLVERGHRRPHRQRRLDGGLRAAAVAQRLLHVQGGGVHVLRLPARRTRRRRNRPHHHLPRPDQHQHRLDDRLSRAGGQAHRGAGPAGPAGADVRAAPLRTRQGGQDAIVSAVKKNKPVRPVTPEAYLLYGTSRLAPQALRSTARGKVV